MQACRQLGCMAGVCRGLIIVVSKPKRKKKKEKKRYKEFCEVNWRSLTLDKSHKRLSTSVQTETTWVSIIVNECVE